MGYPTDVVYDPTKLQKYPHLLPRDIAIWERFLEVHAGEFVGFQYDIHVGGAVGRLPGWTIEDAQMASWLEAKRIDVVGFKEGEIWIIEVKHEAGVGAFGQLMAYRELYWQKYSPKVPVVMCLVTNNLTPDEQLVCEKLGIRFYVV